MSFQSLFQRFHEAIKLKRLDENAELIEKRERIARRLRDNLPSSPSFEIFNQGSYAMGTGIKPLKGDYDIDLALVFDVSKYLHTPVEVKSWVYEAVSSHTTRVEWRRPCITVYYQQAGEAIYHVDLAVMARSSDFSMYLALGKEHSARDQQEWQPDDRLGFIQAIKNRFHGEDAAQFRRVIRYLKRWKDVHFPHQGHAAPTGLSLTVAAYYGFQPSKSGGFYLSTYDDLAATTALVRRIEQSFEKTWNSRFEEIPQISLQFPNAPHDDVFARMTPQQMVEFYQRLQQLSAWLDEARRTQSTGPLRRAFGADFPEE